MSDGYILEKRKESAVETFFNRIFFIDFIKGLSLTLKYNLSRSITLRYPDEEKWIPYKRFRGQHTLNRDEYGRELCVGCELCAKSCPTDCITVIPMEDSAGRGIADRVARVWEVNLTRCMFCGLCEDACPTEALKLGREYELSCFSLSNAVMDKDRILIAGQGEPLDLEATGAEPKGWMKVSLDSIDYITPLDFKKGDRVPANYEGGVNAAASLERTEDGIRVVPDLSKTKKWW